MKSQRIARLFAAAGSAGGSPPQRCGKGWFSKDALRRLAAALQQFDGLLHAGRQQSVHHAREDARGEARENAHSPLPALGKLSEF